MGLFLLFMILAALCLIALIAGAIGLLVRGQVTTHSGRDAGAVVMDTQNDLSDAPDETSLISASRDVFAGTGVRAKVEAETSFAEFKKALRERRWVDAWPAALIFCGLLGFLLSGSLALWAGAGYPWWALVVVGLMVYFAARQRWTLVKA